MTPEQPVSKAAYLTAARDTYGPPCGLAADTLRGKPVGSTVVITRKGRGLLRWDATLWLVRDIDGTAYPWMSAVGFGCTRRGALRSMRRDPAYSAPTQEDHDA